MSPPLPSLSNVNPRSDDKTPVSRSPPYPSPPNEEHDPIERHQLRDSNPTKSHTPVAARPPSPRQSSPKPRADPESSSNAPPQPAVRPAPQEEEEAEDEETSREDIIDMEIFGQLLELDEDEPDFSKGMVDAYFVQAETTFKDLDEAFGRKDLPKLSSLGHYLKGSSAALGISHVEEHCERIQHYGALRDEEADKGLSPAEALSLIGKTLVRVKKENRVAEKWLREYYKEEQS